MSNVNTMLTQNWVVSLTCMYAATGGKIIHNTIFNTFIQPLLPMVNNFIPIQDLGYESTINLFRGMHLLLSLY